MTFKVEITAGAKIQIQKAYRWYQDNTSTADTWLEGLFKALESLSQFPKRCQLAPEHDEFRQEIRQLLYGKPPNAYRILFSLEDNTVYILHVRHIAQARLSPQDPD